MNINSIPECDKSSFARKLLLSTVADSRAENKNEITKFLRTTFLERAYSDVRIFYTSDHIVSLIKSKDNSLSDIFETFSILSEGLSTLFSHGEISHGAFVAESSFLESIKQICLLHGTNFIRDILIDNETEFVDNIANLKKWINVFESSKIDGMDELV